jgi:transcription elongation factor GreA
MSTSVPMTKIGLEKLKDELKKLKTVDRPQNVKDIEEARAHGDISENAEFAAAKERQSHIAGRMQQIEDWIARAEVVDVAKLSGDRVVFGATVTLSDPDTDKKVKYRIVGELEADLKRGLISVTSPIARGIIGKEVGDEVHVQAPGGAREYEITEVKFVEADPISSGT